MASIDLHHHKACLFAFVLIVVLNYSYGDNPELCGRGLISPGYTYPTGDIVLKYGEDLNISCILYENDASKYGKNASQYMTIKSGEDTLPTKTINATAIELTVKKHPKTSGTDYVCFVNKTFVCHNIVIVGVEPQNVTDFDCIAFNIENITCTWTSPENYVATSYKLEYGIAMRSARTAAKCPNMTVETKNDTTVYSCTWSLSTDPQYRHSHENFEFYLKYNNVFGSVKQIIKFNHFAHVIPDVPKNFDGNATGPHSIHLSWDVPTHMKNFPVQLEHRISYWLPTKQFKTVTILRTNAKTNRKPIEYTLTDLPFANCLYDIRVALKSSTATEERMWSKSAAILIRTMPELPSRPPKTNIGSFEYIGEKDIVIYWQKIKDFEENGKSFGYHIETEGFPNIKPKESRKHNGNYARFEKLTDMHYTFRIYSENEVGRCVDYTIVSVPPRGAVKPPENFIKEDKGNDVYELEWTPSNDNQVISYTIFWCNAPRDRPYQCDGNLNWTLVPSDQTSIKISLDRSSPHNIYQFAISANADQASSGMMWADCTVIPGRGVKLRQVYVKSASARSITLAWKLECVKMGDVIGFNITYCPTGSPLSSECLDHSENYTIINGSASEGGSIKNLTPYTRYKINVKPWLISSESQFSESMFNMTFEDIASQPRNLQIVNVTNSSLAVLWQRPEFENGFIRKYIVTVGDVVKEYAMNPNDKIDRVYELVFTNLSASATYNVSIRASTIGLSPITSQVVSTLTGRPGIVLKPSASWQNSTVVLRWEKPVPQNSRVDYYQVWTSTTNKDQLHLHADDVITNVTGEKYNIASCAKNVFIKIRAVNLLDGKPLAGPWSDSADIPCLNPHATPTWYIGLAFLFVMILLVPFAIYASKKFYRYVFRMSNIEVKLPTGLSGLVENVQENEKHSDEILHSDEPLLSKQFSNEPKAVDRNSIISKVDQEVILSTSDIENQNVDPSFEVEKSSTVDDSSMRERTKKPSYVTMSDLPTITQSPQQPTVTATNVPNNPNSCLYNSANSPRVSINRIAANIPSNSPSGYKLLDLFSVKKNEPRSDYKPLADVLNSLKPKLSPLNLDGSKTADSALRQRVTKSTVKHSEAAAPEIAQVPQPVSQTTAGYSVMGFISSPNIESVPSEHIVLSDMKKETS